MIMQIILTSLLAMIALYATVEYRRSPFVGSLSLIVAVIGIYLTWSPQHASALAAMAGVGRGVDLIIYTWVVISLLVILNLHLKLQAQLELITALARQLAIQNAEVERRRKPAREHAAGPASGA